jgi:hypothetical protein
MYRERSGDEFPQCCSLEHDGCCYILLGYDSLVQ